MIRTKLQGAILGRPTLDNAHVAEDYLARTTTMYRIIKLVGLVLYPEPDE